MWVTGVQTCALPIYGRLAVRGRTVLSGVPDNVAATHASGAGLVDGAFVGAAAGEAKSHHVFTFGTLR